MLIPAPRWLREDTLAQMGQNVAPVVTTGATAARVGKVSGGDTVLLVALSTSSYDWHDGPLSEY